MLVNFERKISPSANCFFNGLVIFYQFLELEESKSDDLPFFASAFSVR